MDSGASGPVAAMRPARLPGTRSKPFKFESTPPTFNPNPHEPWLLETRRFSWPDSSGRIYLAFRMQAHTMVTIRPTSLTVLIIPQPKSTNGLNDLLQYLPAVCWLPGWLMREAVVRPRQGCYSARKFDPSESSDIKSLACRSASNPRAEQHRNGTSEPYEPDC